MSVFPLVKPNLTLDHFRFQVGKELSSSIYFRFQAGKELSQQHLRPLPATNNDEDHGAKT
jgi:hypothetical protein